MKLSAKTILITVLLLIVSGCSNKEVDCATDVENAIDEAENELLSSEEYQDRISNDLILLFAKKYISEQCEEELKEKRSTQFEIDRNAIFEKVKPENKKHASSEQKDKTKWLFDEQRKRLSFKKCIPYTTERATGCRLFHQIENELITKLTNNSEFSKVASGTNIREQVENIVRGERDWDSEYKQNFIADYDKIRGYGELTRDIDLISRRLNKARSQLQSVSLGVSEYEEVANMLPDLTREIDQIVNARESFITEFETSLAEAETRINMMIENHKLKLEADKKELAKNEKAAQEYIKSKEQEAKIARKPTAEESSFANPLKLCDDNFKDMKSFMLATTRSFGNEPTQKEIDDLDALHWCDCTYEKIAEKTRDLNIQSVVEDLIDIENLVRKASLLKGGELKERERTWFTRSLNNGETVMVSWGLSIGECQNQ